MAMRPSAQQPDMKAQTQPEGIVGYGYRDAHNEDKVTAFGGLCGVACVLVASEG
jgi:hypothetical protein